MAVKGITTYRTSDTALAKDKLKTKTRIITIKITIPVTELRKNKKAASADAIKRNKTFRNGGAGYVL